MDSILIIVRGPSGSGKSHLVKELKLRYKAPAFSNDDLRVVNGIYKFNPKMNMAIALETQARAMRVMQYGEPVVIIDNTHTNMWEMEAYVRLAWLYDYEVEFVEPEWNEELKIDGKWNVDFLARMQSEEDRIVGKFVPYEVLEGMVAKYHYNVTLEDFS